MKTAFMRYAIFIAGFFSALHVASLVYTNSAYLAEHLSIAHIGTLYIIAALLSLGTLHAVSHAIHRFGTRTIFLGVLSLIIMSVAGMVYGNNLSILQISFVVYFSVTIALFMIFDIMLEHWSQESSTGLIRGSYLALVNLGYLLAPLSAGIIIREFGFNTLYLGSLLFILPLIALGFFIPNIRPLKTKESFLNLPRLALAFFSRKSLGIIFVANFILQFFYAWMVIYVPLYLANTIGIPWSTIGILLTIMLLPFVIFQYPAGKIADKWLGEKEMLLAGFLIMGVSTLLIPSGAGKSIILLGALLFATRIGASLVEVMSDAYFFKKVTDKKTEDISIFRSTYPLAYILAPIAGGAVIFTGGIGGLFPVLGIICLAGALVIVPLKDTR